MEYLCTTNIITDDKLSQYNIITTIEDLNKVVIENKVFNKIIMRKDFIDIYFPFNNILSYINNVKKINKNISIEFIDYEPKKEVNKDFLLTLTNNLNKEDLMMLMQFKTYDFIETLHKLILNYSENSKFELDSASTISELRSVINKLNEDVFKLKDTLSKEIENKVDFQNKLSVLVKRINYTHNVGVDESMLFVSDINSYDKVIYIKEITRIQYMDTLIDSLQEILKLLFNIPTRVLVIEGYYATGKVSLYPKLKPHYSLTEKDVLMNDILMLGYQPKIFKDIMRNPSNISILIILDRGGYYSPHLFGDNVEYLFTASDPSDVKSDVPMSRIISYKEDTLFIPHIKGFEKLSPNEKVQKYSSLKIIKQIVSLLN